MFLRTSRSVDDCDAFFGRNIGICSNVNIKGLLLDRLSSDCLGVFSLLIFLVFLQIVNGFFSTSYHIILGVELVIPVGDLIHTESHAGSDFSSDGWWFNGGNDLMLELSDDIIDKEDGSLGGEEAHRNIVES